MPPLGRKTLQTPVTKHRIALTDLKPWINAEKINLFVLLRSHAFIVGFAFVKCVSCLVMPVQSGSKFWACPKLGTDSTVQTLPLVVRYVVRWAYVLFGTLAFLVLLLSVTPYRVTLTNAQRKARSPKKTSFCNIARVAARGCNDRIWSGQRTYKTYYHLTRTGQYPVAITNITVRETDKNRIKRLRND